MTVFHVMCHHMIRTIYPIEAETAAEAEEIGQARFLALKPFPVPEGFDQYFVEAEVLTDRYTDPLVLVDDPERIHSSMEY